MTELPVAESADQYEAIEPERLQAAAVSLCQRLGLPAERVERFEQGSLPVYALDDGLVLKLYPQVFISELAVESATLRALAGRLPIPTPGVRGAGTTQGWGYLVMDRLRGESLADAWPRVPESDRERLIGQLGAVLARLHAVPPPAELGPVDWESHLRERREACVATQRALGVGEEWLAGIPGFLDSVELPCAEGVLLHTEFMSVHVLVQETAAGWSLTGLFDFEPALRGAREYDLVAVGLFVTRGDPVLMRRFLTSYGYADHELAALPRVTMAYALLHAQCHLPWFMRELPAPEARTFDELAERWFGVARPAGG